MYRLHRKTWLSLPVALGLWITCAAGASAQQEPPSESPAETAENGDAKAAESAPETTSDPWNGAAPWRIEFTNYGWFSGLKSTVEKNGRETTTEAKLSDLVEVLDFAGFTHLEVQRGKWGMFTELDFVKVSGASEVRLKRAPVPLRIDTAGSLKQTMFEIGAIRSFDRERFGVDLLAGARYYRFDIDSKVGPFGTAEVKDWVDPIVGARLRFQLADKWDAFVRGDVGGFGVGSGSEMSLNGIAALRYTISDRYSLGFGYRYLRIDYEARDTELTMETFGPIAGLSIRF